MGTFTTKLKLGSLAFGVSGGLDPSIRRLTVGQVRVIETLPHCRSWEDEGCYKEEYMCEETGVGSGTVWTYGKDIFATEADAQLGVIAHRQAAYRQRAERDAYQAEQAARTREADLLRLKRLKEMYE